MPAREWIIIMKRAIPKKVTLPNGRTFVARYKCVTRDKLPSNMGLRQPYKQRRGRCRIQQGRCIGSNILKLPKKVVKAPVVWELGNMALNELPNLYSKGTNKIKNKKIRKILKSDLANTLVDMGYKLG